MTSQDQIFHDLLAEREIHRVLLRYCRGVDRADEAVIAACFHPDARDDHGNWLADGASVARHIVDVIRPGTARAMHFMGNALIEVEGDTAFAESYILAFRAFDRDGVAHNRTRAVRFIDRFERRDAQWRISERVVVDEWSRVDQVVETLEGATHLLYGAKDRSDAVYRIRQGPLARTVLDPAQNGQ